MKQLIPVICLCALVGCTSTKSSNTARTATEQLLISNAVDKSLSHVNFAQFAGQNVYVEEKYMDSVDKNYTLASVRHRLMMQGAVLKDKKEDSDITIELRSGGIGTDSADMYVGIPEVSVPGMVTIPEIRMITKAEQSATAKLGMIAYNTKSGEVLGYGGTSLAQSNRKDWFVMGIGPYQNGSLPEQIEEEKAAAEMNRPVEVPRRIAFASPSPYYSDYSDYARTEEEQPARIRLTNGEKE